MDRIEERKKRRVQRANRVRIAIAVIFALLAIVVGLSVRSVVSLKLEQNRLIKENASLRAKKAALEQEFENINDKNYIEEQARQQLNMVKPGEIVYIIEDEEKEKDKDK